MTAEQVSLGPVQDFGPVNGSRANLCLAAAARWSEELAGLGGRDPLLSFRDLKVGTLDLGHADAKARQRLMDGETVSVSKLFPYDPLRSSALRSVRAIRDKGRELGDERGISGTRLAVGVATWADPFAAHRPTAPVLLRSASVVARDPAETDFMITVADDPGINPVLMHALDTRLGLRFTADDLRDHYGNLRYPTIVEKLHEYAPPHVVDGFAIDHRAVLATFATEPLVLSQDVGHLGTILEENDVVAALAGDESARTSLWVQPRRDAIEFQAFPLDPYQQAVVEAIAGGSSIHVDAPPGTGHTQTVAAAVADLVGRGKRVLVVGQKRATSADLVARLSSVGLRDLVVDLTSTPGADAVTQVVETARALVSGSAGDRAAAAAPHLPIDPRADAARTVDAYAEALHRPRAPWDISAWQALVAVATAPADARTDARIPVETLRATPDLALARARLHEFAAAGGLSMDADTSPWFGADVYDAETADEAVTLVTDLRSGAIPSLRDAATRAAVEVGLAGPSSIADCLAVVDLLDGVASTVSRLGPDIWAEPLDELAAATSDRAVVPNMGLFARRHLRTQARELTGDQRADRSRTHRSLERARRTRDEWARRSRGVKRPKTGPHLAAAIQAARPARRLLARLAEINPRTANFMELPFDEVGAQLRMLADDYEHLHAMPRLRELRSALAAAGVDEILEHLRAVGRDGSGHDSPPGRPATVGAPGRPVTDDVAADATLAGDDAEATDAEATDAETSDGEATVGESAGEVTAGEASVTAAPSPADGAPSAVAATPRFARRSVSADETSVGDVDVQDVLGYAQFASLLDMWRAEDAVLRDTDATVVERALADVSAAEAAAIAAAAPRVRASRAAHVARVATEVEGQTAVLAGPDARVMPRSTRELIDAAPDLVLAAAPVWVMSPLSVAEWLPPQRLFDVVIIEDAGRVAPAHAVPALARASQVVLVGDDEIARTSFTTAVERGHDPDDTDSPFGDEPEPSIVDALHGVLPPLGLSGQHRVRDDSLVGFAARTTYSGRMRTVPGVRGPGRIGLELVEARDGGDDPIDSSSAEVARVVDLVLDHVRTRPHESLGVVTLGQRHAERVDAALRRALVRSPDVAGYLHEDRPESFFVKDVERVGGDVRDAIILTLGYGRSVDGRILYRFGALGRPGGERRLASATTRARERLTVVSTFGAADLSPRRLTTPGAVALGDFLASVERSVGASGGTLGEDVDTSTVDRLADALATRLVDAGAEVEVGVGGPGGVPVAVRHPARRQRFVLAVLTDGPGQVPLGGVRRRDRVGADPLRRLGWSVHRVWAVDWAADPDRETARLIAAYEAAVRDADAFDWAVAAAEADLVAGVPDDEPTPKVSMSRTTKSRKKTSAATPAQNEPEPSGSGDEPESDDDGSAGGQGDTGSAAEDAVEPTRGDDGPPHREGTPPPLPTHRPVGDYSRRDLAAVARWIESDGISRREAEVVDLLREHLDLADDQRTVDVAVHAVRVARAGAPPYRIALP